METAAGQDTEKIEKILADFIALLKTEIGVHPHNFFLEDDLRCFSYMALYRLLEQGSLLNTTNANKEIRLRSNFNPYSYHKQDECKNVAYDLAILNADADNEVCIIEFKFSKHYSRWGKRQKYGRATLSSLEKDFNKISKEKAPLKYCILVELGIERNPEVEGFINSNSSQGTKLFYFVNEAD